MIKRIFALSIIYLLATLFIITAAVSLFLLHLPLDVIFSITFAIIAYILYFSKYYPEGRYCNTCGNQLFLPLGADHFWCAICYHPLQSLRCWIYIILWALGKLFLIEHPENFRKRGNALKARIREESIREGLRKTRKPKPRKEVMKTIKTSKERR